MSSWERPAWEHRHAVVNGVRLHYVEAGAGPLVILLHGFPEFWYTWRHQIPALAAAGFRVIAPDMRGYNESEKPRGIENYRLEKLTGDVAALIAYAGVRQATVVGHDWGGGIAWAVAMQHPEVVAKLAVLNAPHPALLARELRRPAQLCRSWYIFFFQLPILPEWLMGAGDFALLAQSFRREPVRRGAFSEDDIRLFKQALGKPGALTAALNYYRAMFRRLGTLHRAMAPVAVPTLLIWGEKDRYLGPRMTEGLERWAPNIRIERLPNASHWVQNDVPEKVNELLIEFLRQPDP